MDEEPGSENEEAPESVDALARAKKDGEDRSKLSRHDVTLRHIDGQVHGALRYTGGCSIALHLDVRTTLRGRFVRAGRALS